MPASLASPGIKNSSSSEIKSGVAGDQHQCNLGIVDRGRRLRELRCFFVMGLGLLTLRIGTQKGTDMNEGGYVVMVTSLTLQGSSIFSRVE